jgi:hypothetical protein
MCAFACREFGPPIEYGLASNDFFGFSSSFRLKLTPFHKLEIENGNSLPILDSQSFVQAL